jgi:hypothetical protein
LPAAVFILPIVAQGREKLMNQVAMGGMDLEDLKTCVASALDRAGKLLDGTRYVVAGHRDRRAPARGVRAA